MKRQLIVFFEKVVKRISASPLFGATKNRLTDADRENLEKLFTKIYKYKIWGNSEFGNFYSGGGSDDRLTANYIESINTFISNNNIKSVVDIGCGDFRVGQKIASSNIQFIGLDIVPALIKHNREKYGNSHVQFICSNALIDDLPDADLCLVRQVLQHLSNQQILDIIHKCKKYKYLIVTEHVFIGDNIIPNIDKKASEGIRLNSGVFLNKPPFNLHTTLLCAINPYHSDLDNSLIQTWLITYP